MELMHDIHNTDKKYDDALDTLKNSKTISKYNKNKIIEFLTDASIGQHYPNKTSKSVGKHKLSTYIYYIIRLTNQYGKDWKKITTDELKKIILDLQTNKITHKRSNQPLSENTKMTMSVILKMFLRWLSDKENISIKYTIVSCREPKRQIPDYLTKEKVENIALRTNSPMHRALIMSLFDAGLRVQEALNVKIKDINYLDTANKNKIMRLDVHVSKTEQRNPELLISQEHVESWLTVHPDRANPEAYLFTIKGKPLSYQTVRMFLQRIAKEFKPPIRLYPHLFRHSSATYYASRLNRQQLCIRYGWTFGSASPDVYINRAGVDNKAVIEAFEAQNLNDLRKENEKLNETMKLLNSELAKQRTDFDQKMELQKSAIIDLLSERHAKSMKINQKINQ